MAELLAVDPGINGCGVAYFMGNVLYGADYVKRPTDGQPANLCVKATWMASEVIGWMTEHPDFHDVQELAIELPQIYQRGGNRTKGDPNKTLVPLMLVVGAVSGLMVGRQHIDVIKDVNPAEWKGQMTKEACQKRVESRLDAEEMKVYLDAKKRAGKLFHNMSDAVGIGLHHLGRFDRKRVICRE